MIFISSLIFVIALAYEPRNYTEEWFEANLDNFGYTNETFQLRYMLKTTYYKQGNTTVAPIFFYTGNQAPIDFFVKDIGFMDYLGEEMGALIVYAEHRYFGKSLPFGDLSFSDNKYTRYLSPHQALADYAYLCMELKEKYDNAPVIAFGGSYGGMLSAWFRMKFPNLVAGAIASSAPVMNFLGAADPFKFSQIVTKEYSKIAPECPASIHDGFTFLKNNAKNTTAYHHIQQVFNTCKPIVYEEDVFQLIDWMQTAFMNLAVLDYPYPTDLVVELPANPVNVSCSRFDNVTDSSDDWELLGALKNATNVFYNYNDPDACSNITAKVGNSSNIEGWSYLTCSFLNLPISTDGDNDMFLNNPWNQIEVNSECLKTWGITPDIYYGLVYFGASSDPTFSLRNLTNVVFSNGSLDPWQAGSVTQSPNSDVVALVMEDGAHYSDLKYPNSKDSKSVNDGRDLEKDTITYWLKQYKIS